MPAKGTRKQAREERLEVILNMLTVQRWPRFRIYKAMREEYGITDRTIRRDFEELGKRIRGHLDDPDIIETRVNNIVESLETIAHDAQAKGNWMAAIRANVELGRILGLRLDRWADLNGRSSGKLELEVKIDTTAAKKAHITKRAHELSVLSTEDLEARRADLVQRFQVLEGGRAEAAGE